MSLNDKEVYEFGDFRLDVDERTVERPDGVRLDTLPAKTFEVLVLLLRKRGHLVAKKELLQHVWPNTIVEENNLDKRIHQLRQFLGDSGTGVRYIETVRGHGYRFVAPVQQRVVSNSWLPKTYRSVAAAAKVQAEEGEDSTLEVPMPIVPERSPWHRRSSLVVAGVLILLASATVGWYRLLRPITVPPQVIESLAVLPFENGSGDSSLDYLSDGLSESLIDHLSKLPQLKVTARTSSFKFREVNPDLGAIAAKLGVQAVIAGSVVKIGDQLKVRVELVDTSENKQIWGDQFIRPYAQITGMQREIAQVVSERLRLELTGAQKWQFSAVGTDSSDAYELYLKAQHLSNINNSKKKRSSVRLLQQAVEIDPNFAPAWAELAKLHYGLVGTGALPREEGERKAEVALKKALELDPDLPAAGLILAAGKMRSYEWQDAESEYRRIIAFDPSNREAHTGYGIYLSILGRHEEAISEGQLALELDPLSHEAAHRLALSYFFARSCDDVMATSLAGLLITPDYEGFHEVMGYCHVIQKRSADGIESFNKAIALGDDSSSTRIFLAWSYAVAGQVDEARELIKEYLSGEERYWPSDLALVQAALGDHDGAMASLEEAYAHHDYQIQWINVDPSYDPLRSDPRFADLIRRIFPKNGDGAN